MLISSIVCHLVVLCFLNSCYALEQLPKDIAPTDKIRDVVNQIFSSLQLKTKKDSKLEEYSTIHKLFVGVTQLENDSWKKITKLTTVDSKIDNGTTDFTTIINDVLNEDNKTTELNGTQNDDDVNEYIENFLTTLAKLKETYLVNNSYSTINTDVLEHLYQANFGEHNNYSAADESNATENSSQEIEFWTTSDTRRIFRGERTKIKYFPFLASVHLFNQFTCAGSIIQSSLIITAASCLQLAYNNRFYRENPAFLSVRVGSPFYNGGGESIPVLEVYFHPTYTPRTLRDNLAIMRLQRKIKFRRKKRNVKKIEFDRHDWALPMTTSGIAIAGWGAKTVSNKVHDPWSNKVSMAILPVYPLDDCQDIYSKEYVGRKNFCAGFISKGGGACNRDVGAPGIVHGILVGVVSFGAPTCGTPDAPTVFTKLGYYYDWIETIMEQEVPLVRIKTTLRPIIIDYKIPTVTIADDKDFKIDPISFKNIKSIGEIENDQKLRMDQDNDFEKFLETMFNSKDLKEHNEELADVKIHKTKVEQDDKKGPEVNQAHEDLTRVGKIPEAIAEENFEQVQFVTSMAKFDPENIKSQESDLDVGMNFTELEKISQIDKAEDDFEMQGQSTPILEEYGLSIGVSYDSREESQHAIANLDNERKNQVDQLDESKKHLNFVQKPQESIKYTNDYTQLNRENKPQVEVSDKILKYDLNYHKNTRLRPSASGASLENVGFSNQLNKKSQQQVEDFNTQLKKGLDHQIAISDESLKLGFNTEYTTERRYQLEKLGASVTYKDDYSQLNMMSDYSQLNKERIPQIQEPDASIKDANTQVTKQHQYQAKGTEKFVKSINDYPQVNKESKYQAEQFDVSKRFVDANTQFNKKVRHHQVMKPEESVIDTHYETQFNKERQNQVKDSYVSLSDQNAYTKFNKQHQRQFTGPDKLTKYIEDNTERKYQVEEPDGSLRDGYDNTQYNKQRKHEVQKPDENKNATSDEKLDEQIDQLLKKLDIEKAIGSELIDYSNDKKVIDDTKLLEFIENQEQQRRLDPTDKTLLTLLFLSESELKGETTKPDEETNEDTGLNAQEGLSIAIDGEHFEDLTHSTNSTDDSYSVMSRSEMYDILADAIQTDNAENVYDS